MRMQDIQVGEVYEVGRNRGPRRGVEFSGMRGVVVKTRVNAYYSPHGKRGYVLLHALDEDGLISLREQIQREDGVYDVPREIWAQAREVATSEIVAEKKDAKAKERALLADMLQRRREYTDEVARKLAEHMHVEPDELYVGTYTNDDGSYHIYRVQLDAGAAKKYLGTDG